METEVFNDSSEAPRQGVSLALSCRLPTRCYITTEKGEEVKLTLAGYTLKFCATYYVCAAGPVKVLRLVGYPNFFIRRQCETSTSVKHGEPYHYIPIRVGPHGIWDRLSHALVYPRELEAEVESEGGELRTEILPVVLHMPFTWQMLIFLVIWALAAKLLSVIIDAVSSSSFTLDGVIDSLGSLFTTPWALAVGVSARPALPTVGVG